MSLYTLLDTIDTAQDIKRLSHSQLPQLATELRQFILHSVAQTGGHLSSNLGSIELTIALHYLFNLDNDQLIWDVGHQAYAHKILTGRRHTFSTLRQLNGISGFPKRSESPYDTFGTAHSSTSISAALGMAIANRNTSPKRQAIAVIGDGAMSAGMAFEALNNAGTNKDIDLLVILNDNNMSISKPVGELSHILSKLLSGQPFHVARQASKKMLHIAPPPVQSMARKIEDGIKGLLSQGTLFEQFGFEYYGPIDGHDLNTLLPVLDNIKQLNGLRFLHVITQKGHGYQAAENDPITYHGVGSFDIQKGIDLHQATPISYTQIFGEWLCDMAKQDDQLIAITPAMAEGSGMVKFAQEYPERFFDVGIAEQHALTFAAGLACEGKHPVVAIYSTFLQRAYDQLIHDIALQNLPIMFAIDRAGLVGADGATHHGAFDLSFMLCIPNLIIMAPSNEAECRHMLYTAYCHKGPSAVRYPRGDSGFPITTQKEMQLLPIGKAEIVRQGTKIALLVFGSLLKSALEAAEQLNATVINMRFIKPMDQQLITELAQTHELLVSIEDNSIIGGAGSEVARFIETMCNKPRLLRLGLPDHFIDHGQQSQLLANVGLDAYGIIASIEPLISPIID